MESEVQTETMTEAAPKTKSLFDRAMERPENYETLSASHKWDIDKELGLLDWDNNCDHKPLTMCADCKKKFKARFKTND